jgi:hypothetical protein
MLLLGPALLREIEIGVVAGAFFSREGLVGAVVAAGRLTDRDQRSVSAHIVMIAALYAKYLQGCKMWDNGISGLQNLRCFKTRFFGEAAIAITERQ